MKMLLALTLAVLSSPANASTEPTQCRRIVDVATQTVTLSNLDLEAQSGDALPKSCLSYFIQALETHRLPMVEGKKFSLILDIRLPHESQPDTMKEILAAAKKTQAKVEIRTYFMPDDEEMNDMTVTFSAAIN